MEKKFENFKQWADAYFEAENLNLDRLVIFTEMYNNYCLRVSNPDKVKNFRLKIKSYCMDKGWIYCPPTMLGYDAYKQRAICSVCLNGRQKTVELIYIQTDANKKVYNHLGIRFENIIITLDNMFLRRLKAIDKDLEECEKAIIQGKQSIALEYLHEISHTYSQIKDFIFQRRG